MAFRTSRGVGIHSDDDGNLVALHVLRACVEFLDKSSDVHAVLTQSGTNRGAGGSLCGVDLQFDDTSDFLCHYKHLLN